MGFVICLFKSTSTCVDMLFFQFDWVCPATGRNLTFFGLAPSHFGTIAHLSWSCSVPRRDDAFSPANGLSRDGTVLFYREMACPMTGRCFSARKCSVLRRDSAFSPQNGLSRCGTVLFCARTVCFTCITACPTHKVVFPGSPKTCFYPREYFPVCARCFVGACVRLFIA